MNIATAAIEIETTAEQHIEQLRVRMHEHLERSGWYALTDDQRERYEAMAELCDEVRTRL